MTTKGVIVKRDVCGNCAHVKSERTKKDVLILRCQLSHAIKVRDLIACPYYDKRE